jgi:hypothetical protein
VAGAAGRMGDRGVCRLALRVADMSFSSLCDCTFGVHTSQSPIWTRGGFLNDNCAAINLPFWFLFCSTAVWTQGLTLVRQVFYHLSPSPSSISSLFKATSSVRLSLTGPLTWNCSAPPPHPTSLIFLHRFYHCPWGKWLWSDFFTDISSASRRKPEWMNNSMSAFRASSST